MHRAKHSPRRFAKGVYPASAQNAGDHHGVTGDSFGVGIEQLPTLIAEHIAIPSVIVLNLGLHMGARVLIAQEPLGLNQLNLLRDHLHPFVGVVNKD